LNYMSFFPEIEFFLPFTEKLIHLLCIVQFSKYNVAINSTLYRLRSISCFVVAPSS